MWSTYSTKQYLGRHRYYRLQLSRRVWLTAWQKDPLPTARQLDHGIVA